MNLSGDAADGPGDEDEEPTGNVHDTPAENLTPAGDGSGKSKPNARLLAEMAKGQAAREKVTGRSRSPNSKKAKGDTTGSTV